MLCLDSVREMITKPVDIVGPDIAGHSQKTNSHTCERYVFTHTRTVHS